MRTATLVARSLVFHRRTNAAVLAGAALATAVIVGALSVGDSVRYSLRRLALARLGETRLAFVSGDRFVRAALADDLQRATGADMAPLLQIGGSAATPEGVSAPRALVIGVDERFWRIGAVGEIPPLGDGEALVSEALAEKLGVAAGSTVIVRIPKPSFLPMEAPFARTSSPSTALRLTVREVAGRERFGRFSLRNEQSAPRNVFVPLPWLQRQLGLSAAANVVLVGARANGTAPTISEAAAALEANWTAQDAGLEFSRAGDSGVVEMRSTRVFIEPAVARAALEAPGRPLGILSYFVNDLKAKGRSTPYSVASAPGPPIVAEETGNDEIVINDWLADDLSVGIGDEVDMDYYVVTDTGALREESSSFKVAAVVPLSGVAADRTLMPDFPGVAEAENTRDWEPGIPIDLKRIRPKDEDYWYAHRGTPKAFVTLAAAKRMWANRFGALTAVRFTDPSVTPEAAAGAVMAQLSPGELRLLWTDVRAEGLRAASEGVDFAQLFAGLSFFLVAAAVLLTTLLFSFACQERTDETGLLLAVGFTRGKARRLLLAEGALVVLIAVPVGTLVGAFYNRAVISALSSVWLGAVRTSELRAHMTAGAAAVGAALSAAAALLAMWFSSLHRARRTIRELVDFDLENTGAQGKPARLRNYAAATISALVAIAVLVVAGAGKTQSQAAAFFAAGAFLLVSGLFACNGVLATLSHSGGDRPASVATLGIRNAARRRGRTLAAAAMFACGVFLVIAIGANRTGPLVSAGERSSGTGGFAFYGETSLGLFDDLNDESTRRRHALDNETWGDVRFVQMRLREGDDASCLNLNRTLNPRIVGAPTAELTQRSAFTFVKTAAGFDTGEGWTMLERDLGADTIAAVADDTVITWGLGKSVGDTLAYTDDAGKTVNVKLIGALSNSIFQGSILVSEEAFRRHFPSAAGTRVLLVDAPPQAAANVSRTLSRALSDYGLDLESASARLADFNTVQNTYLSIFLALGGLALVIGGIGMGVVILRNALERRQELAVMRALGFSRASLVRLLLWEHWFVLGAGIGVGCAAAVVAVLPALLSAGSHVPVGGVTAVLAAVAASGAGWTYIASRLALRGDLMPALRNE